MKWTRKLPSLIDVLVYGAMPMMAVAMMFNATLILLHAESTREVVSIVGAFVTGAAFTTSVYSVLMRRAARTISDDWESLAHDVIKTTLVKLQRAGLVHPDFKFDHLPGDVDEEMVGVGFEVIPVPPANKRGLN